MRLIKSGLLFAFLGIVLTACQAQILSPSILPHTGNTATLVASEPAPSQTATSLPTITPSLTPAGYIIPTLRNIKKMRMDL